MRKWYAFFTGKKVLGVGLTAIVALTALLAVNFYRGQNEKYLTTNGEVEAQTEIPKTGEEVAEEMNHELPIGSEVGEQQLADSDTQSEQQVASENMADGSTVEGQEASDSAEKMAEVAGQTSLVSMNLNFDASKKLQWPVAGRNLIKSFSMDGLVYYPTLEEYKVCPAIMVQAQPKDAILAPADGVVLEISANEEIGTYLRLSLGDGYEAIIGNLDNVSVAEGDYLLKGTVLGGLAEPTKYYLTEGPNVYFELLKDDQPIDPLDFLE